MKKWKILFLLIAFSAVSIIPTTAYADSEEIEQTEKLKDNTLEYEELELLIKYYNPAMLQAQNKIQFNVEEIQGSERAFRDFVSDYKEQVKELKEQRRLLLADARANNTEQTPSVQQVLAELDAAILMLEGNSSQTGVITSVQKIAQGYKKAADSLKDDNSAASRQMQQAVNQMTMAAQQLMISYDNVITQKELLSRLKVLQQSYVDAAQRQKDLGMGTELDILKAKKNLSATESSLARIETASSQLRSRLCVMTGWSADAQPEILPVPSADLERIGMLDLQSDIQKAIGNNLTLISERHTPAQSRSSSAVNNRLLTLEESEQRLKIEMERLYQDVLLKKAAYDVVVTSYEKTELAYKAAKGNYQYNRISKLQFLGAELELVQSEASRRTANTALRQSLEIYDWAVKGYVDIPQ